ncbi:centrosome-associated protein ALMS1 isoform X2 [Hemicordylus capensis]|uniref:centrosome-associated protein ALMS1 isoform X2 n=1 Tax=Hemicordylus capensis TaxID=884348 RepID=UPI002302A92A|nr:centrosome-associated protein ALMS1 isoform X2 [Hemicordylus capensis]
MEVSEEQSVRVPPIVTTPPHPGVKEELLSQSSSGTQISNASGFSLGEAIRQRSAINREMEAWYHPCAEIDTSNVAVTLGRRLGQTVGVCELTEFPSMEEGLIIPTEDSRSQLAPNLTHSPLLEVQDSCFSPNLPLLTTYSTQGRTFFNETLFQTGMDFAPLRGTPDVSGTASAESSRPLQMSEAVQLAATDVGSDLSSEGFFLSQHPLAGCHGVESNASLGSCLSQLPTSLSEYTDMEQKEAEEEQMPHLDAGTKTLISSNESVGPQSSQKVLNQQLAAPLPSRESQGIASGHDLFRLDSNVPAPLLLEMLEKEVGLSKYCGFLSSSESSSCKSVLGQDPEGNEMSQLTKTVALVETEADTLGVLHQQGARAIPELDSLRLLSESEGKPVRNVSVSEQSCANTSQGSVAFKGRSMDLGDSCVIAGISPRLSLKQQPMQQISKGVFEEQKRELVSAMADCRLSAPAPLQLITMSAERVNSCREQMNAMMGIQSRAGKSELTLSDFVVEREHKNTGISPSFNEGSFFGQLAHPIHHSTPGVFTTRSLKQEAPGAALPVKPTLQSSLPHLHEETSKSPCVTVCIPSVEEPRGPSVDNTRVPSSEEPLTLQSGQDAKHENSDYLAALHPLKSRIYSLPSLNFMEKVGAWNVSQSAERMSDALALGGVGGISPRQKAYSAIADSLNHILLKQQSQVELKEGLAASVCGPSSMAGLHTYNKKSPCVLPLTRSQSENSVVVISREISRAEAGPETNPDDAVQAAEDKNTVVRAPGFKRSDADAEDPITQHYTAVLVSTVSSDEESISRGRSSNPDLFVTSERVAELLREEAGSLNGDQENSDGSPDNTSKLPGFHLGTNQISMGHFSDVSPDSLNQVTSSEAGSCADLRLPSRQSSRRSSAVSGRLHSSLEDILKTPDDRELNIEERIPVYLRNLGIDQSPSSILTPFMLRGPIREVEFSPTELRTLKASTDILTQHLQASEGDSRSVMDVMQSSFNSSSLGVPVPVRSSTDPEPPLLPIELSPKPPREVLSQCGVTCSQLKQHAPTPYLLENTFEFPAVPKSAEQSQIIPADSSSVLPDNERSTKCVQMLMERFDLKELDGSQEKLASSSLSREKDEMVINEETSSASVVPDGERDDSFLGSKTLKEIDKLLAEAENKTLSRSIIPASSISSTDLGSSLTQSKKIEDCEDSVSVKQSNPGLQRMWSWDEAFTRQSVCKENASPKTLSLTGSLKWGDLHAADYHSNEQIVEGKSIPRSQISDEGYGLAKQVVRSEPEGCNNVAPNTNLPVFVSGAGDGKSYNPREIKELQAVSSAQPLDGTSDMVGDFHQVSEKAREAGTKGPGSNHESENSSSVDSLGLKVKNLLQRESLVMHAAQWVEEECQGGRGKTQVSAAAGIACSEGSAGIQGSDNSSSLDSLAARVKMLLEDEQPVMHATQILRSAEEDEKKARAWVKLKLAAHSADFVTDLTEEDQQKIDAIKREYLLGARKAGIVKDQLWGNGCERISSHSPVQKPDPGHLNIPSADDLQVGIPTQSFRLVEFPEVALQARPVCGTDCALPSDPGVSSLSSSQNYVCNPLQTHSDDLVDSRHNVHVSLHDNPDTGLTDSSSALTVEEANVLAQETLTVGNSSVEPAKQITSITFASRKRTSSPPASPVTYAGHTEAVPCGLGPLDAHPANTERLPKTLQTFASANPATTHSLDARLASSRDHHQHHPQHVSKERSFREESTASAETSQANSVEQKIHTVSDNCEEAQASFQILTGLRRHDRPIGGVYDQECNPEETVTDQPLSINSSQQKIDSAFFQNQLTDSLEKIVCMPKTVSPKGKESILTKEDKFTIGSYSCGLEDANLGNSNLLPSSSTDHTVVIMPVSPSSPTKKALSGVHITLSPKRIDLGLSSPMDSGAEMKRVDELKTSPWPANSNAPSFFLEATSKLKPTELSPKTQDSAYFPGPTPSSDSHDRHSHIPVAVKLAAQQSWEPPESRVKFPVPDQRSARVLGSGRKSLEDNFKTTTSSQTERLLSDAITQITESPEKTTYSAEIFVNNDVISAPRSSHQKSHEIPSPTTPALKQSLFYNPQTGKPPLLLPYKPPGSMEMYYVPCPKETLRLSRVRSETTMESSHSGSNDAIPPEFPAQTLGSGVVTPPDAVAIKHNEGIYSKRVAPKVAWTEEKIAAQEGVKASAKTRNPWESVNTTHSVFGSAQFYLHHPVPLQHEIDFLAGSQVLGQHAESGHPAAASRDFLQNKGAPERSQAPFSLRQPTGQESFSPLNAEPDYSLLEESRLKEAFKRESPRKELTQPEVWKTGQKLAKGLLLPSSQMTSLKEKQAADLPMLQSSYFTGSLDELWTKYLERQKQHQQRNPGGRSRSELSLVERLDRLARLLQNPIRQSLVSDRTKDEQSSVQVEAKRKEPKKVRSQEKMALPSNLATHSNVGKMEQCPDSISNAQLSRSRDATATGHTRVLEQLQDLETQSNTSSEMRSAKDSSVFTDLSTYESDVTAQAETETATQTEASVSVSTIDTARLIKAFGHDRVQVSPKLSQLYSTINLQKTRSEKWAKGSRKATGARVEQKRKEAEATASVISSDSISTVAGSRGPSSALSNKRNTRMLNKAIQTGDFEIVHSATKKHTRDVGLTFPTPTSSQAQLQGAPRSGPEEELVQPDGLPSGSQGKPKRQPSSFLVERRPRRRVSWFVSAEDLKLDPQQGNGSNYITDPGPLWFEPETSTKPWREPLREKNWQGDRRGLQVRQTAPARDVENKPPPPFVKMTLQEALALHRPDFISRSGERVKRLKLIMEERKLQNVLQSEREELFNPPEERRGYRHTSSLQNRDYRAIRRKRAISKSEMVQRSKRIYEQLPEVRKRREEEKRKSDYSTYRLKAQLYKTKVTNRLLGRKVPWE